VLSSKKAEAAANRFEAGLRGKWSFPDVELPDEVNQQRHERHNKMAINADLNTLTIYVNVHGPPSETNKPDLLSDHE
jgi:hypothetical protein